MAKDAVKEEAAVEQEEAGKEEISSATEIMQSMVKTSKGFKMYLSNNPLLQRFLEELRSKLKGHLERYNEIKFDIDQFELKYKGKTVYESRDPKESLAFRMYSDGIRSLIFSAGLEDNEISDFLEIVGKERATDIDDDMVTLLWIKDLPNITYILAEDYLEFDSAGAGAATHDSQQEKIKGLYKAIPSIDKIPSPMMIPQNILSLKEEEIEWLKKARDIDEKRNPLDEVVHILFSILSVEKDPAVFGEFIDITAKLIENLLHSGEFRRALDLAKFLRDLSGDEKSSPEKKERLFKAMEMVVSGGIIKDLEEIINTTEKIKPEELKEFLLLFGKAAIRPVCELLGSVQKMEMRKIIVDALVEIGRDAPGLFLPFLADSRWYLVRNTVIILRNIGSPALLEQVGNLASHKEPKVRKEVLLYLETISDARAMSYIIRFLKDDISSMRLRALKALAGSKSREALKPILEIAASKEFEGMDITEKKAVFEALGELGSDDTVPMFKEKLMKRYWFNKAKEKESVLLAVAGLRKAKTDAAIKALEEGSAVKKKEIRTFITQAIRNISAEKTKAATK